MPAYSVEMNRTAHATLCVGAIYGDAAAPRRSKLFRLICGSEGAPADVAFLWQVQRQTTAGTSTAVAPQALDAGDGAAINDAGENYTVNGTLTAAAILLSVALHQRATFHFYAVPGREIVMPATAGYGVGIWTPTMTALAVTATVHYEE